MDHCGARIRINSIIVIAAELEKNTHENNCAIKRPKTKTKK